MNCDILGHSQRKCIRYYIIWRHNCQKHNLTKIARDKNKNVVGVYDGTNDAQMKDLINDVKVLLAEYKRPVKNNEE